MNRPTSKTLASSTPSRSWFDSGRTAMRKHADMVSNEPFS